jgi:hypothetical protein
MDDTEFEAALGAAFRTPSEGVVRRDFTAAILERVRNDNRARLGVLAGAGLVGVGIATTAVVATQLARPLAAWTVQAFHTLRLEAGSADATPFVCVGLALTVLAVIRNPIRDLWS